MLDEPASRTNDQNVQIVCLTTGLIYRADAIAAEYRTSFVNIWGSGQDGMSIVPCSENGTNDLSRSRDKTRSSTRRVLMTNGDEIRARKWLIQK